MCTCDDGYKLQSEGSHICEPICSEDCVNGTCTEPDVCECNHGYEKDLEDGHSSKCKPTCSESCVSGVGIHSICVLKQDINYKK